MKTLKPIPQTKTGNLAITHLGLCPIATWKGGPWSQWRLKSPWASILKSTKQRRWSPRLRLSLHRFTDLLTDAFTGSISITKENTWEERPHFFCIGPQSSRHVLFVIDDSYAGISHHRSRKDDFLLFYMFHWFIRQFTKANFDILGFAKHTEASISLTCL